MKRISYDHLKISQALADEQSETGITVETLLLLRPSERRRRLSERMKKRGIQDSEIPKERRYRDFWERLKRDVRRAAGDMT
jgi:hypothetical protein